MKSFKVILLLVVLLAAGAAAFFYWRADVKDESKTISAATAGLDVKAAEESGVMNIQDMEISQGEKGVEVWRLKAARARLTEENGVILLHEPFLTYFWPSEKGDPPMTVRSRDGEVEQKEDRLRFKDDVLVRQEDLALRTELMVYEGAERVLTCPGPTSFQSDSGKGDASSLRWDLKEGTIYADGGVRVEWENLEKPAAAPGSGPASGPGSGNAARQLQ